MEEQGKAHRLEEEGTTRKEFVDEDIIDTRQGAVFGSKRWFKGFKGQI